MSNLAHKNSVCEGVTRGSITQVLSENESTHFAIIIIIIIITSSSFYKVFHCGLQAI